MIRMRRAEKIVITLVLLGVSVAFQRMAHPQTASIAMSTASPSPSAPSGYVLVARAVDGDTIELADGQHIRYLGIDTPETVHPNKPIQCYGPEASARNHTLIDNKYVRLVRDAEDADRYGRPLRYVYLQDGTFVNLSLVADGYARSYTWPPNIAHAKEFVAAQTYAKAAGLGLWSACPPRN